MTKESIPLKGGDEVDVHTGWRKFLSPHNRMIKAAKRSYNKRFRKHGKEQIKSSREELE